MSTFAASGGSVRWSLMQKSRSAGRAGASGASGTNGSFLRRRCLYYGSKAKRSFEDVASRDLCENPAAWQKPSQTPFGSSLRRPPRFNRRRVFKVQHDAAVVPLFGRVPPADDVRRGEAAESHKWLRPMVTMECCTFSCCNSPNAGWTPALQIACSVPGRAAPTARRARCESRPMQVVGQTALHGINHRDVAAVAAGVQRACGQEHGAQ